MAVTVNVPQVSDPVYAVQMLREQGEIGHQDIIRIFGCSGGTATKLKRAAAEVMAERGTPSYNSRFVNTVVAYETWGLNGKRLEAAANARKLRMTEAGG